MVAAATPYLVVSEASVRHEVATGTRTLARLAAEVDGRVVGVSRVRDRGPRPMLMVMVDPTSRRRGVGRALLEAALPYAVSRGATEVGAIVDGDDASQAAAVAWGFTHGRRHTTSAVDPRSVRAAAGDVVRLAPARHPRNRAVRGTIGPPPARDPRNRAVRGTIGPPPARNPRNCAV